MSIYKKIKVFAGDTKLCEIYPYATKFQVFKYRVMRIMRKVVLVGIVGSALYVAGWVGSQVYPNTVYAIKEVEVKDMSETPVLARIAKCESGNSHLDKNGQVLINKTQDIGVMQINVPIWGKKATELGYNLAIEADNRAFGRYLYENFGTEPWVHTKSCWNK